MAGEKTIYAKTLPLSCDAEKARGLFTRFGRVANVELRRDSQSGAFRGSVFIEFEQQSSCAQAIAAPPLVPGSKVQKLQIMLKADYLRKRKEYEEGGEKAKVKPSNGSASKSSSKRSRHHEPPPQPSGPGPQNGGPPPYGSQGSDPLAPLPYASHDAAFSYQAQEGGWVQSQQDQAAYGAHYAAQDPSAYYYSHPHLDPQQQHQLQLMYSQQQYSNSQGYGDASLYPGSGQHPTDLKHANAAHGAPEYYPPPHPPPPPASMTAGEGVASEEGKQGPTHASSGQAGVGQAAAGVSSGLSKNGEHGNGGHKHQKKVEELEAELAKEKETNGVLKHRLMLTQEALQEEKEVHGALKRGVLAKQVELGALKGEVVTLKSQLVARTEALAAQYKGRILDLELQVEKLRATVIHLKDAEKKRMLPPGKAPRRQEEFRSRSPSPEVGEPLDQVDRKVKGSELNAVHLSESAFPTEDGNVIEKEEEERKGREGKEKEEEVAKKEDGTEAGEKSEGGNGDQTDVKEERGEGGEEKKGKTGGEDGSPQDSG